MSETSARQPAKTVWRSVLVGLLVVVLGGAAVFFYMDGRDAKDRTPEAIQSRNQSDTERVVSGLSNILLIETDEEPTVARVEEPDVLQGSNPDFYKSVQAGDYLVLYPGRAIVYREAENKIINVAPIINTEEILKDQRDKEAVSEPES